MYILLFEKNLCGKPEYTCILWGVQVQKSKINQLFASTLVPTDIMKCVIPENTNTSPMEGIFSKALPHLPPTLWKFQLSFVHFFKFFGLTEPPPPKKFQSLLWGKYGYFLELNNTTFYRWSPYTMDRMSAYTYQQQ